MVNGEQYPLSHFQEHPQEHLQRLRNSGGAEVLTVDGKPELVVLEANAYERLLAAIARAEAIEGIQRGLEEVARGEGRPARETLAAIREKYAIPSR